jgi:plastocyanin
MLRRVPIIIATAALAIAGAPSARAATTYGVTVQNMSFMNGTRTVHQGDSVRWTFADMGIPHTSTSNQNFWRSSQHTTGTYTAVFRFAGRFGYHCEVHPHMTGTITVPLARSGTASTGYTLRWSVATTTPTNRNFDLAVKKPGTTTWVYLRHATTTASMHYNPTPAGTYQFRARTRNLSNNLVSSWTPVVSLPIT